LETVILVIIHVETHSSIYGWCQNCMGFYSHIKL